MIHQAARLDVCDLCHLHARIIFSDNTASGVIVNPGTAIEVLKKSIEKGKLLEIEKMAIFGQILQFILRAGRVRFALAEEHIYPKEAPCEGHYIH
ncbi:MAG: hypothetical protein Q8P93_01900 [bacterium]|nr:hypothetical protein [bacterium]